MPLFIKRTLHGTDTSFTLVYSVVSVGSLHRRALAARRATVTIRHVVDRRGRLRRRDAALRRRHRTWPSRSRSALVMGFGSIAFMTASTAIVQMRADPAMRGRVLALQAIVFLGTTPIGGPLIGWVCQPFGARAGVMIGGVACLVAAAGWGYVVARSQSHPRPRHGSSSPDHANFGRRGQWTWDSWPCRAVRRPAMSAEWNTTRLFVAM